MDLGVSILRIEKCNSRACLREIDSAARSVLKIGWRPISVFPEAVEKFSKQ